MLPFSGDHTKAPYDAPHLFDYSSHAGVGISCASYGVGVLATGFFTVFSSHPGLWPSTRNAWTSLCTQSVHSFSFPPCFLPARHLESFRTRFVLASNGNTCRRASPLTSMLSCAGTLVGTSGRRLPKRTAFGNLQDAVRAGSRVGRRKSEPIACRAAFRRSA